MSVEELLEGVSGAQRTAKPIVDSTPHAPALPTPLRMIGPPALGRSNPGRRRACCHAPRRRADRRSRATRCLNRGSLPPTTPDGTIPDGWQPRDHPDISPSPPDGTGSIRSSSKRQPLVSCAADCAAGSGAGRWAGRACAALAERIYTQPLGRSRSGDLPLAETIFRCVLSADHGGLTDGALVECCANDRARPGLGHTAATYARRFGRIDPTRRRGTVRRPPPPTS